ncbi:hypothetical protein GGR56DRAFT_662850 [Xylariaceae sp. FL0804]|nr:hypothetical protein GGR56DRAFT_662850 [Xylariaceae sp. FL0804]
MADTILRSPEPTFGSGSGMPDGARFVDADDLRSAFAAALSQMYKAEVPLYGDLVRLVGDVNGEVLARDPAATADAPARLARARHGAVRLGTADELHTARRLFALLGMHPVGYYDLSVAGLPMHATCFRPVGAASLARNPFRVFTTLLRPGRIRGAAARDLAARLLAQRRVFSPELVKLLDTAEEAQGSRVDAAQGAALVRGALRAFGWAPRAAASRAQYARLAAEHPVLADVACFRAAHVNHLTPRTLDVGRAQRAMAARGLPVKDRVEGPPARACPVLLRQTSFLALEERVQFPTTASDDGGEDGDEDGEGEGEAEAEGSLVVDGSHKARFGEIEERGAAVTPAGRELYDELLSEALDAARGMGPEETDEVVVDRFRQYPDTWEELRRRDLVYFRYRHTGKPCPSGLTLTEDELRRPEGVERLIGLGLVEAVPITYEDFLPFSAAGIFQSNLQQQQRDGGEKKLTEGAPDQEGLEAALGCPVVDPNKLYAAQQDESLVACLAKLRGSAAS